MPQTQLRALGYVTRMQPRYAAYEATVVEGDIPLAGMAQLFVEVAPGNDVFSLADAALKATPVRQGAQVVEREFGFLELHAAAPADVQEAGDVILNRLGLNLEDRLRPVVVSMQLVPNITPFQAQIVNRSRSGSLVVPQDTLLVLEVSPAAYVLLAANEAENAAEIDIVDIRPIGRFGRLYLAGTESNVRAAAVAAESALEALNGRTHE